MSQSHPTVPASFMDGSAWRKRCDFAALSGWIIACLFIGYVSSSSPGHDFRGYYAAARVLASGGNPYDYREVAPVLLSFSGHMGNNPYYYPLWFAWCFAPLTCLPFQAARDLWLAFNVVIWIASLWQLSAVLEWPRPGWPRWSMFLLASYVFAGVTLPYEQTGILLFALFVAIITAAKKEAWNVTGILLASLLIKPNITLIPVIAVTIWLARRGQWRPVIVSGALVACLILVTSIATPHWFEPILAKGFARGLVVSLDGPDRVTANRINTTLLDWLKMLGVGGSYRQGIYLLAVLGGSFIGVAAVRNCKSLLQVISTSILISFAITPYAVQYDYPPLVMTWFLATASCTGSTTWCALTAGIFIATILIWERPISDGYWIVVVLSGLATATWWQLRLASTRKNQDR